MSSAEYEMTPEETLAFDTQIDQWEYHATEHRVDELISLAADICLSEPLPPLEKQPRGTERTFNQKLVSAYGLHGLRAAFELDMGLELGRIYTDDYDEEKLPPGTFLIALDTPLRLGPQYRDPVNLNVMKKVEQFGHALIEESFATLGEGADENVEKMRSSDPDEQMEAIKWLSARISEMKRTAKYNPEPDGDDNNDSDSPPLYHPIRLSPKAMGEYPEHQLAPTCLGASILVSSFFEKAGVPYLHAGVQMTAYEHRLEDALALFIKTRDHMVEEADWPSPIAYQNMDDRVKQIYNRLVGKDNGYHACAVVKRADGRWIVVDPFFKTRYPIHKAKNEEMDRIYQTLNDMQEDAPGLELSFLSQQLSTEGGLRDAVAEGLLLAEEPEQLSRAGTLLLTDPDRIYYEYILPIFERVRDQDMHPGAAGTIKDLFAYKDEKNDDPKADLIKRAYDMVFEKYVLWGEPWEKVCERGLRDVRYFNNRLIDLLYMPEIMAAAIASINLEEHHLGPAIADKLELGLPSQRVGFSVLSDFAAHSDDPLPPTFWFAHWSSLIPVTELMERGNRTVFQREIMRFTAEWSTHKDLTYIKAYSLIKQFLSARSSEEETENGERDPVG